MFSERFNRIKTYPECGWCTPVGCGPRVNKKKTKTKRGGGAEELPPWAMHMPGKLEAQSLGLNDPHEWQVRVAAQCLFQLILFQWSL